MYQNPRRTAIAGGHRFRSSEAIIYIHIQLFNYYQTYRISNTGIRGSHKSFWSNITEPSPRRVEEIAEVRWIIVREKGRFE